MRAKALKLSIMIGAVCCILAACGEKESEDSTAIAETGQETTTSAESKEIEEDGEMSTESETAGSDSEADDSAPFVKIHKIYREEDYEYLTASYDKAEIIGENYTALKEAVDEWMTQYEEQFNEWATQYVEDCKMQREDMQSDEMTYSDEMNLFVERMDSRVTSFLVGEYEYAGGAHGYYGMYGMNYDSATGEEITFDMLGDIQDVVLQKADEEIEKVRTEAGEEYLFEGYENARDTMFENPVWYLDSEGFVLIFNTYEIGAYAEGNLTVEVPYDQMPGFNEKYLPRDDFYSCILGGNYENERDFDGDGVTDRLKVWIEWDEDDNSNICISYNDQLTELGYGSNLDYVYYVHDNDDRNYILFSYDAMSDDFVTELYEIKDGSLTEVQLTEGCISVIAGDRVGMNVSVDVLGTYGAYRSYRIEDGAFVPVEERFDLGNEERQRKLILAADVKGSVMTEDGMMETGLVSGTILYPVNTDGESVVGFYLDDGTYGELYFTRKDWTIYIDGVEEYELFEELPYAG